MGVSLKIFLLSFCCSYAIQRLDQVSAAQESFQIITDEATVEKLAIERATQKPGLASRMMSALKRLTICGSEPLVKIEFCRQFLPLADLGLTFDSQLDEKLTCQPNMFHIRHPQNEEIDNYTIEMFSCPDLIYNDLETDEETFLSHRYHVANGRAYNAAIVFIQKKAFRTEEKIYPTNYITDIVFKKLVPQRPSAENFLPVPETPLPKKDSDYSFVESQAAAYEEARKLDKPYEKFQRTFLSLNLCGFRRTNKVNLCRESARVSYRWYAQLQYDGYDEYLCRKRRIRIAIPNEMDVRETEVPLLLCPRIESLLDSVDDFLYLSSTLLPRSVFFFVRKNERGEPFVRKSLVENLNMERIAEDQRRARFMLYPSEEERADELQELRTNYLQKLEETANSVASSVRMPTAIASFGYGRQTRANLLLWHLVRINPRKSLVEDTLISFSKIKTTKFIYERFKMTHWSLDICQQPKIVRRQLCTNILTQDPYGYEVKPNERNVDYSCSRHSVHLRAREIENLQPMEFSMWHCPKPTDDAFYNYFIAKCHLKNSAFVFRTYRTDPDAEIYPDTVVTSINRDYLSTIKEYP